MRRIGLVLCALSFLVFAGCPEDDDDDQMPVSKVYVLNQFDGTMFILDDRTLERLDSINLGVTQPHYIDFSYDGQFYYVVSRELTGRISKYSRADNSQVGSIPTPSNTQPTAIAFTPDDQYGYVANFGGLDPGTRTLINKYDLSTMTHIQTNMTAGAMTHDIRTSIDGERIVACNMMSNEVTVIYPDADSIINVSVDPDSIYPVPTEKYGPYGILPYDDNLAAAGAGKVFVACRTIGQVRIFDLESRVIVDSIMIPSASGGPTQMAYDPITGHLFVSMYTDNSIVAVDVASKQVIADISLAKTQSFGVTISDDGERVYVACANTEEDNGWVYKIDNSVNPPVKADSTMVGEACFGLVWHEN